MVGILRNGASPNSNIIQGENIYAPEDNHHIDKTITRYRALEITSIASTKAMTYHYAAET